MLKTISIISVICLLILLSLYSLNLDNNNSDIKIGKNLIEELETSALKSIRIKSFEGNLELYIKKNEGWYVKKNDYPIDYDKVQDFLVELTEIKIGDLITKDSSKHNGTCPIICADFNDEDDVTELPCKHLFTPESITKWLKEEKHFSVHGVIESPILGPKGNKEFLILAYNR